MTRQVSLKEFQLQMPALLEQLGQGDELIIARDGKPLVKVVSIQQSPPVREPGSAKGLVEIADDFNDPLPDEIVDDFYR